MVKCILKDKTIWGNPQLFNNFVPNGFALNYAYRTKQLTLKKSPTHSSAGARRNHCQWDWPI
jgi:hypothetical protein